MLQAPRGLPPARRSLHTRASMASQLSSASSYFETFEFERPESRDNDLISEVNHELTARSSTIRLAAIEETPTTAHGEEHHFPHVPAAVA